MVGMLQAPRQAELNLYLKHARFMPASAKFQLPMTYMWR